jgi:hypothetical protein
MSEVRLTRLNNLIMAKPKYSFVLRLRQPEVRFAHFRHATLAFRLQKEYFGFFSAAGIDLRRKSTKT